MGAVILPGTGRGTIRRRANGGGGESLRKAGVYAARKLWRALTLPEAMLWNQLRAKKLGFKVRRQHPVGPYVVDFYVREGALVIEVDGEVHDRADQPQRDAGRDAFLRANGYPVLRFAAVDVMTNMDGVIAAIAAQVMNPLHHPSDGPPPHAGEEP